jgi:hypothetical protein
MKSKIYSLAVCIGFVVAFSFAASAQSSFSDANVAYSFELPSSTWKMTTKPSASSPNVEYVYGDRSDGYLEIRKMSIGANEIMSDVLAREQEQKLQFLPGFVAGRDEDFNGTLRGKALNFEFTKGGKNMTGRYYFLRDGNTVYVLRFTGLREKMGSIRNQTDSIARTFKVRNTDK